MHAEIRKHTRGCAHARGHVQAMGGGMSSDGGSTRSRPLPHWRRSLRRAGVRDDAPQATQQQRHPRIQQPHGVVPVHQSRPRLRLLLRLLDPLWLQPLLELGSGQPPASRNDEPQGSAQACWQRHVPKTDMCRGFGSPAAGGAPRQRAVGPAAVMQRGSRVVLASPYWWVDR